MLVYLPYARLIQLIELLLHYEKIISLATLVQHKCKQV